MFRAVAVPRRASMATGRHLARATRRRLATTTTPPTEANKTNSIVRKLVFYSIAGTGVFYIGSTFVSYEHPQYRQLFTQNVPLGEALVEYGERRGWDEITIQQIIISTVDGVKYVSDFVQKQLGRGGYGTTSPKSTDSESKEVVPPMRERAKTAIKESKERVKSVAAELKTSITKTEDESVPKGMSSARARYKAAQFADELDELIRKAEAALAEKVTGHTPVEESQPPPSDVELVIVSAPKDKNVYEAPLPIGFEPPPGYVRPKPIKEAVPTTPTPTSPPPPPEPLPLVAPVVSDLAVSEPTISHLAHTIDNLASYVNSTPAASENAKDVLETAKHDLQDLASRIEKIKEEGKHQLEQKLDQQACDYNTKLLELEIEARDKLDLQQEDFNKFMEQERAKYTQVYREKLANELKTQTELINERLKEEVIAQGIEMQRRWIREVKVKVEEERGGRLARLDELATNLKCLERLTLDNSSYLDENIRVHALWTAVRAMQAAVDGPNRKPFREELRVLRHITAAKEDPVVSTALNSLESTEVPDVGVEPLADLTSWFTTSVVPRVSSVALVPDQDAGILSHLASHLLTSFSFRKRGLTPGNDVLSVLSRAEYYLNEQDLDTAARELNQLTGTAKELLYDWLEAARRRLEVQQALEVIQTEATLASLLVV